MIAGIFRPWLSSRTWWTLVHLTIGPATAGVSFSLVVALAATAVGLVVLFPLAIGVGWLMLRVTELLVEVERSRYRHLLGHELTGRPPLLGAHEPLAPSATWWARTRASVVATFRDPQRWRDLAWTLCHFPVAVMSSIVAVGTWSGAAAAASAPAWIGSLPGDTIDPGWIRIEAGSQVALLSVVGVIVLGIVAPWITVALGRVDATLATALLEPSPTKRLKAEVDVLATRRSAALDSAEAERRRIERDLHDGAQQRLIAVAMELGLARERIEQDPADAARFVASAHEDVKAAMKELRDLVRGIHPAVLDDRGLDAALSAVVARCSVPVTLAVDLERRPPAAVESAAYFIVTECLVNVDRHARASRATVEIARVADRLTISIGDDGIGGATPTPPVPAAATGTGLAGLADRVTALGGSIRVISPTGGPTSVIVELPCEY